MYNAFLRRTQSAIAALVKHIQTSDRYRAAVFDGELRCSSETPCFPVSLGSAESAPDRLEWRIIDHCAAVTRIYALYEQFVHEMLREHISLLQSRLSFQELPEVFAKSYRIGVARILEKKDGPRFDDLNLGALISSYDKALSGLAYTIEPRAMLMQEQNLRLPELRRLLSACGIEGVTNWIEQHNCVAGFFASGDRLTASAESQLSELIEYRNDAAHGSIDISDVLHVNVLVEFCDFISAICEAISERVQLSGLRALQGCQHADSRGKITELLRGGKVSIAPITGKLKIGDIIYLCGNTYCLERKIVSLQLEDVAQEEVDFSTPTELGMMFDGDGRKNASIVIVRPLLAPAPDMAPSESGQRGGPS